MDNTRAETILRITARYVEEIQTGFQPKLSDYLARYPQYANEIADFVAYYHTVETNVPTTADSVPALPEDFHIAMNIGLARALQSQRVSTKKRTNMKRLTTLLVMVNKQRLTVSQLADKIGLSEDIVTKLERREIAVVSIPGEVYKRLAQVLDQPLEAIQAYFKTSYSHKLYRQQVAEAQVAYQTQEQGNVPNQSFREIIEGSGALSVEQKRVWLDILKSEGL